MMAYCTFPVTFITSQERSVSTKVKFTVTEGPNPHLFPYIVSGTEASVQEQVCLQFGGHTFRNRNVSY